MGLFAQALTILFVGMATVFAFLAVVIWSMGIMSRIVRHFESRVPRGEEPGGAGADPGRLAAVIAVAITERPPPGR